MVQNIIFSRDFCYFKDISDKVTVDDDVTGMMMSSIIYCVYYYLYFFVIEIMHHSQNFTILQYYFHYSIQQLPKMNIFLCKCNLYRETAEKAIFLNYDVINDVMMMQCIYQ